ncbi:hypothetical protein [Blastococcus goldschmidtiae]|uniref:Thiolase-like protein type 1 additional C-terminal domain-containing protein n=1 Tax=Blastococcus goldschmidtiae TaxID=3075546 RepID=A0ABU2K5L8_9ACTN|nr:hypothetical protein [Blastococcus sp. DSM 46792]MDT0275490.1 hypothetical protein [Blastococcus sp. DSM 46792]
MLALEDSLPVVIGGANVTRKPRTPEETTEPADLLAAAVRAAAEDAGLTAAQLAEADSLDVINLLSWNYADPTGAVGSRVRMRPSRASYSPIGGDQPTRLLAAAAARVQRGQSRLAVVVGGESLRSRRVLGTAGVQPEWTPAGHPPVPYVPGVGVAGPATAHGLRAPVQVYPMFELARRAALDATPAQGQRRSAEIQAGLARVAARVPGAAVPSAPTPEQIATPDAANRWVSYPYTKYMCANSDVDQSAATIVTTYGHARALGVRPDRMVFLWGAAGATDTTDVLERATYADSAAIAAVLRDAVQLAGGVPDLLELYSCFPVIPWIAASVLDVPPERELTVAGGLTFYGGPINAYMSCAANVMLERLREAGADATGLLYGNGEYATKHHALVVSAAPPPGGVFVEDDEPSRQKAVDAAQRPGPRLEPRPDGAATIESYTVLPGPDGELARAVVIGRLGDGARFVAGVADDAESLPVLTSPDRHAVGLRGTVRHDTTSGLNTFAPAG